MHYVLIQVFIGKNIHKLIRKIWPFEPHLFKKLCNKCRSMPKACEHLLLFFFFFRRLKTSSKANNFCSSWITFRRSISVMEDLTEKLTHPTALYWQQTFAQLGLGESHWYNRRHSRWYLRPWSLKESPSEAVLGRPNDQMVSADLRTDEKYGHTVTHLCINASIPFLRVVWSGTPFYYIRFCYYINCLLQG